MHKPQGCHAEAGIPPSASRGVTRIAGDHTISRVVTRGALRGSVDPEHATTALLELEARGLAVAVAARRLRHARRAYVDGDSVEREIARLRAEVTAWEGDVTLWRGLGRRRSIWRAAWAWLTGWAG